MKTKIYRDTFGSTIYRDHLFPAVLVRLGVVQG
jgi:hypothetical protein